MIDDFAEWFVMNHLLNVNKTREIVISFRMKRTATEPITVLGQDDAVV